MMQIAFAVSDLSSMNQFSEAYRFIQYFKKPVNRSSIYGFAAQEMLRDKIESPLATQLIDSSRMEMLRVKNTGVDQQSRFHLPYALAMRMNDHDLNEADKTIKNVSFKFFVSQRMSRSLAFHNNLHESYERIPPLTSASDKTVFLWNILYGYSEGLKNPLGTWKEYATNYSPDLIRTIWYEDENN